jgi:hypothetical protein
MNMRDLLNKLDTVSEDSVSEDGRYYGHGHNFYQRDNYYGNPRQYGDNWNRNFGVGAGIGVLGALALQNRGNQQQQYPQGYYPPQYPQGGYPPQYPQGGYPPQYPQGNYPGTPPYFPPGSQAAPMPGYIQQRNPAPSGSTTTTDGPAVPVGPTTLGPTTYYGPNGEKSDKPFPQSPKPDNSAGAPASTTTGANADADKEKTTKITRFKELLAKAGVDKPTGLDSVDKFNPYSLTGDKPSSSGFGIKVKESSDDGFARDPLLEKLRLIERGHRLYEGLTPDEYKELSKLYGDLSVTYKNDPKLAPLFAQYDKVPASWSSDADKKPDATDPAKPDTQSGAPTDTTKPQQWGPGVLHTGSVGPEVTALQNQLGIKPADGKFGPATKNAVMAKQKELGVTVDGAWGPKSKAAFAAKGGTAGAPADTTKTPTKTDNGEWTGSAKDWGSAIGGGLGAAVAGGLGGAIGPAGVIGGGVIGHEVGSNLGGKAGEWLGGVGDKVGKSWDAAANAWNGKSDPAAAAPAGTTITPAANNAPVSSQQRLAQQNVARMQAKADQLKAAGREEGTFVQDKLQPKESIEVNFADQLIESFGYQSK